MSAQEFNSEVENTKKVMEALLGCVKNTEITSRERKQYLKEYMQTAEYYIILQQNKPTLTIA